MCRLEGIIDLGCCPVSGRVTLVCDNEISQENLDSSVPRVSCLPGVLHTSSMFLHFLMQALKRTSALHHRWSSLRLYFDVVCRLPSHLSRLVTFWMRRLSVLCQHC